MAPEYFNRITDTYGLGVDEFLDLFERQGHACAICQCALVLFSTQPCEQPQVDHDHDTGKVRGILCRTCNVGLGWLGWLEKDRKRTVRLADYLEADARAGAMAPGQKPKGSGDWTAAQWRAWRLAAKGRGGDARKLVKTLRRKVVRPLA